MLLHLIFCPKDNLIFYYINKVMPFSTGVGRNYRTPHAADVTKEVSWIKFDIAYSGSLCCKA